jgi:hypothetical protein
MSEVVASLGTTSHRKALLSGLLGYRELLYKLGYENGFQFIDGSFCENVEVTRPGNPNDIDVFSYLKRPAKYFDPNDWKTAGFKEWNEEVVDRDKNKRRFLTDTYAVDINANTTVKSLVDVTIYWYGLYSHKRVTLQWKGFVVVILDKHADSLARSLLQGST